MKARDIVCSLLLALLAFIVTGMLIVAIGRVRDAAQRSSCQNNLKQMGSAISNYAGDHQEQLPGATLPNPRFEPEQRLSWLFQILPYVESGPLYVRVARDQSWDAEENRFVALRGGYNCYRCPAFPDRPPASTLFPTHYVGIAGVGADAADYALENPRSGVFGHERKVYLKDLTDGFAFTMSVAETLQVEGAWTAGGRPTVRGLNPETQPYLGRDGQFGSGHRGSTTHALMVDGSIRVLSPYMSPHHFEALATIAGRDDTGFAAEP